MNYQVFERQQDELHGHMIERYDRAFRQFSSQELVRVFHELIDQYSVNCLFELGAHRAATSKRFVNAKKGRKAIAVEANPFNCEKFKAKAVKSGVLYIHRALTAETGPVNFVLSDSDQDRKRGHTKTSNSILLNLDFDRTINVEVPGTTLDDLMQDTEFTDYVPSFADERIALWVDVEGALSQLLEGAQDTLPKCLFALAELEKVERFKGQKTAAYVAKQFENLGFVPFLSDSEYMPTQHNVIFVNSSLIAKEDVAVIHDKFVKNITNFTPEAE